MTHPAELSLHQFMTDAVKGKTTMPKDVIRQVGRDVTAALKRQFSSGISRDKFSLRMSNIGRPTCQLWFQKNKPELAEPKPTNFLMNMLLGDIVEAVFKGLLKAAGVKYTDSKKTKLKLKEGVVTGSYDLIIDGAVDDVRSASDWSYKNKFQSFDTLADGDAFGYVGQLAGYAQALNKRAGGWWVINKANGNFKYVPADGLDLTKEIDKLSSNLDVVESNEFKRCFEPVEETFRGKPTGNKVLTKTCSFCRYKQACWSTLQEIPSLVSQAREPKIVSYVEIRKEKLI